VLLSLALIGTITFLFAHKQFGIRVTAHGIERSTPLGKPPVVAKGVGPFSFIATQRGTPDRPVAYDPCRPIQFEVNADLAPPHGERIVRSAVASVSTATGLVFEDVGTTHRLPTTHPSSLRPRRSPALIAWTTPEVVTELTGRVVGIGGSSSVFNEYAGQSLYVTGTVALDAPQLSDLLSHPGGEVQARAIVMHELGHLVGLGHVKDRKELMYKETVGQVDWGPGDREGLAALGAGRCFH
jgi:hypothetical protein